ncbi:hypothetical protein FJ692_08485 [Pseudomonas fluorescens]|nr:hypothetical protein FJ692_08485 [Pseudomonas fluorescens]
MISSAPSNHAGRNSTGIWGVNRQGCRFSRPAPRQWICTQSNCVDCQAVFAGKPAPTFGSWAAREIGAGCQAVTGASSLATGTASHESCVDTYGHRRQASSHIDCAHCLSATFPTYRRALQPAHFGR